MLRHVPLALLALASFGCDATTEDRLRACGIVSEGYLPRLNFYDDACYRACFAGAECDALLGAICRTDVSLLVECDQQCAPRCDDGSLIGLERVCNGFEDCEGGEDEEGCAPYVCDDGQELMGSDHRCNGWSGCRDGSDEEGCAPDFVCGDGTEYQVHHRCNGWTICEDGSDEEGCATFLATCE